MLFKLKNYKTERNRRIKSIKKFDKKAVTEWNQMLNNIKLRRYKNELQKYYNFLKKLKFKHQNHEAYFSHPLRVAYICHNLTKSARSSKNLIILSLFHNIIETSNLNQKFLKKYLGKKITNQIKILTVNRKMQWNNNYKKNYYKKIYIDEKNTRIVKIIDKLDNLFIIGLCKSELTRKRYISEIENYILPMVKNDIPKLKKYFNGLIKQSYSLGYYKND
jgi:(p)ppGpp synthase/HD superfamily hydrolase